MKTTRTRYLVMRDSNITSGISGAHRTSMRKSMLIARPLHAFVRCRVLAYSQEPPAPARLTSLSAGPPSPSPHATALQDLCRADSQTATDLGRPMLPWHYAKQWLAERPIGILPQSVGADG